MGAEYAVSGFLSFTGCDQAGKFFGHSKLFLWRKFKEAVREVIQAFQGLGKQLTDEVRGGIELFAMSIFCNNIPSSVKDVSSFQWYLFSK